jgi:hypothetical protein
MPAETREDGDPAWSPDLSRSPRRLTRIPGEVVLLISGVIPLASADLRLTL